MTDISQHPDQIVNNKIIKITNDKLYANFNRRQLLLFTAAATAAPMSLAHAAVVAVAMSDAAFAARGAATSNAQATTKTGARKDGARLAISGVVLRHGYVQGWQSANCVSNEDALRCE